MKTLLIRFVSAALAVIAIFLLHYFFQMDGLRLVCFLIVVWGTRELIRILFLPDDSLLLKIVYFVLTLATFTLTLKYTGLSAIIFSCIAILFFSLTLIRNRRFDDLSSLAQFQAKGILGLFYIGLLPAFATKLLYIDQGLWWFITLLAIVFAGDIFAYLFGMLWGKKKLMPEVSPKKTVVGSIGGLLGSIIAGGIMSLYLDHVPFLLMLLMGAIGGLFGQMGDLFESMLKRVANVKDSGSIMPGHGGVLDRIDSVLFTAPFVLLFAYIMQSLI